MFNCLFDVFVPAYWVLAKIVYEYQLILTLKLYILEFSICND